MKYPDYFILLKHIVLVANSWEVCDENESKRVPGLFKFIGYNFAVGGECAEYKDYNCTRTCLFDTGDIRYLKKEKAIITLSENSGELLSILGYC